MTFRPSWLKLTEVGKRPGNFPTPVREVDDEHLEDIFSQDQGGRFDSVNSLVLGWLATAVDKVVHHIRAGGGSINPAEYYSSRLRNGRLNSCGFAYCRNSSIVKSEIWHEPSYL